MPKSSDSKTSIYQSNYTDRAIRADQKIAELIIERQAAKSSTKLNQHFWDERQWKPKFLFQMRLAASLLKRYNYKAILAALNSKGGKNILSLKASWLDPLLEQEQIKYDRDLEIQQKTQAEKPAENVKPAETFRQNDTSDRLNALENL